MACRRSNRRLGRGVSILEAGRRLDRLRDVGVLEGGRRLDRLRDVLRGRLQPLSEDGLHLFGADGAELFFAERIAAQSEIGQILHPSNLGRDGANVVAREIDGPEPFKFGEPRGDGVDAVFVGRQGHQARPTANVRQGL